MARVAARHRHRRAARRDPADQGQVVSAAQLPGPHRWSGDLPRGPRRRGPDTAAVRLLADRPRVPRSLIGRRVFSTPRIGPQVPRLPGPPRAAVATYGIADRP